MTFHMPVARGPARPTRGRRGALLLLTLSVLTLFMMIGTLMLVLAMRARSTARAFADATAAADSLLPQAMLDEALMVLLRGGANLPAQITSQMPESMLEDRYGQATIGTAAAGSVASVTEFAPALGAGVLLKASIEGLEPPVGHPCDLNGRVLTLQPDPDDGDVASYRILRTTGASEPFTVYLANTTTARSTVLPKKQCRAIINGPEFLTEAHDSYDQDSWLAWIPLQDSRPVTNPAALVRPSFSPSFSTPPAASGVRGAMPISALTCDNDNDGVPDGVWIDGDTGFLPPRPSPLGGTVRYKVSYLALDLDGRINLNAHGSPVAVTTVAADWRSPARGVNIASLPVGLGYGPADVDVSRLLGSDEIPGVPGNQSRRLTGLMLQSTTPPQALTPTAEQRRPAPQLGNPIEGRYGPPPASGTAAPGAPGASQPDIARRALQGASPTDLFARTRMFHTAASARVPTLVFYSPDRTQSDFLADPYQLRLDADGPRVAVIRQPASASATPPADNPFTVSELERVLRPVDADVSTLPPRLATALDDYAQRSRLTVTTDSWDTPAMAGTALQKVRDFMGAFPPPIGPSSTCPVYGAISPDVSAGLRFNVNRPLDHPLVPTTHNAAIKQRYCQHLYTLLCALDPSNTVCSTGEKAQWAVNVCDFRDPDSTMTIFRYDANPTDGWNPTTSSPVVIGAERPEVVITEIIAWTGHASAVLYHPWNAITTDSTDATTATELVDPVLQGTTSNTLLLSKTHNGQVSGSAVWRLRFDGGGVADFRGSPATTCTLAANQSICVQTADPLSATVAKKLALPAFVPPAAGNAKLILERLADPTRANDDASSSPNFNPYVAVDEANVTVAVDQQAAQTMERSSGSGFWKSVFTAVAQRAPGNYPHRAPWLHWPNRPFVSVGELALVPTGSAAKMLADYRQPTASQPFNSLATNPALELLDAVHVPSRFVGTSQSIGLQSNGTWPLLVTVAGTENVCTTELPRWREPGRVNINTVLPNTGNASNSQLDDGVWKAVAGDAAPANPFNSGQEGKAADSFTKLLALTTTSNKPPLAQTQSAPRDRNPFFNYSTAIRLANVATIRSHVFAVWITLEVTDDSATAPPPSRRRLFAVVDRSIPVGFSRGENLNVRDTIRVLRYLD